MASAADADAETGFAARTVSARDGLRLFYRDYGERHRDRASLLCLPGLARNSKDFHELARRHAGRRRAIAPDYRGRGRSEWDPDWRNYQPRVYLDDLWQVTAASGLERAVVVGTSLGGALAMALGVLQPSTLAGVVLNDIGPEIGGAGVTRILAYIGRDRPQPDWPSAARHLQSLLPMLSIKSEADWLRFARATYREGADGVLHFDWDPAIVRPLSRPQEPVDLWALFRSLAQIPLLLIRGGASDVLSEATVRRMREAHPRMIEVVLAGVGHAPSLSEPESVQAIDAFLGEL
jgi:pimeloyl-ACP methyl ester carboxylesterase